MCLQMNETKKYRTIFVQNCFKKWKHWTSSKENVIFFLKGLTTLSYYSSKIPQKWVKVYNFLEIKNHEKSSFSFFEL